MEKKIVKLRLDASLLRKFKCKLCAKRIGLEGYTDKLPWNDTQYGSAFHRFISTMFETEGDFALAINKALEKLREPNQIRKNKWHLNETHLIKTCTDYWNHFKKFDNFEVFKIDGKPAVEIDFDILFLTVETEDTIYQVWLEGTVDKMGRIRNGAYCIGDYKTHSLWTLNNSPKGIEDAIKDYFEQYILSNQLNFYMFCMRLKAQQHPDSELGQILSNPLGAFIDGVFLSKSEPTMFRRSEVFTKFNFDLMHRLVTVKANELVWLAQHPEYSDRDGIIVGVCVDDKYPCQFLPACKNEEEEIQKIVLANNFKRREYNPLQFSK